VALAVRSTALAEDCDRIEPDEVKMYRLILVALAAFIFPCGQSARAESDWLNDYKKAQEQAKAGNKLLLLNFTGSDWCGWCIKFDKEVLSQPQFKQYAHNNLVLATGDAVRGCRVSHHYCSQQRRAETLAIRGLLLWRSGRIHRRAAKVAERVNAHSPDVALISAQGQSSPSFYFRANRLRTV